MSNRIIVPHPVEEATGVPNNANLTNDSRVCQEAPIRSALDAPMINPIIETVFIQGGGEGPAFVATAQDTAGLSGEALLTLLAQGFLNSERTQSYSGGSETVAESQNGSTLYPSTSSATNIFNRNNVTVHSGHSSNPFNYSTALDSIRAKINTFDLSTTWNNSGTIAAVDSFGRNLYVQTYLTWSFGGAGIVVKPVGSSLVVQGAEFGFVPGKQHCDVTAIQPGLSANNAIQYDANIYPSVALTKPAVSQTTLNPAAPWIQIAGAGILNNRNYQVAKAQMRSTFPAVATVFERLAGGSLFGGSDPKPVIRPVGNPIEMIPGAIYDIPLCTALSAQGGPGFPFTTGAIPGYGGKAVVTLVHTYVLFEITLEEYAKRNGGVYFVNSW